MSELSTRQSKRERSKKINYQELSSHGKIAFMGKEAIARNGIDMSEVGSNTHHHVENFMRVTVEDETSENIRFLNDGTLLTATALRTDNDSADDMNCIQLNKPIIITDDCSNLGMKIPKKLSVRDISEKLGHAYPVTCMDISTQEETNLINTLEDLADYFEMTDRSHLPIINQISLEFSGTPLARLVKSPAFVRELDWIDNAWPIERKNAGDYPRVQYYCLTSAANSYTDFHIDFGGTSVWYHIVDGRKDFLLIPPTETNLEKYEEWLCSPNQNDIFFGNVVEPGECFRVKMDQGMTLIIPTAWIHAVYTPVDSVVFGGNFLHSLDMVGQLNIHCIETRAHVQQKYKFPYFIDIMFYVGAFLLRSLRNDQSYHNENIPNLPCHTNLCDLEKKGIPRLIEALRSWNDMISSGFNMEHVRKSAYDAATSVGYSSVIDMIDELSARANGSSVDHFIEKIHKENKMKSKINIPQKHKAGNDEDYRKFELPDEQRSSQIGEENDDMKIFVPKFKIKISSGLVNTTDQHFKQVHDDEDDEWKPVKEKKRSRSGPTNTVKISQQKRNRQCQSEKLSTTTTKEPVKKKPVSVRQRLSKKLFRR